MEWGFVHQNLLGTIWGVILLGALGSILGAFILNLLGRANKGIKVLMIFYREGRLNLIEEAEVNDETYGFYKFFVIILLLTYNAMFVTVIMVSLFLSFLALKLILVGIGIALSLIIFIIAYYYFTIVQSAYNLRKVINNNKPPIKLV